MLLWIISLEKSVVLIDAVSEAVNVKLKRRWVSWYAIRNFR